MFVFMKNIKIFGIIRQDHFYHQSLKDVLILECVCQHRPSYQWWGGDDYHRIPIPETVLRKQMFSKCHRRSPPTALPTILVNLISAPSNNRQQNKNGMKICNTLDKIQFQTNQQLCGGSTPPLYFGAFHLLVWWKPIYCSSCRNSVVGLMWNSSQLLIKPSCFHRSNPFYPFFYILIIFLKACFLKF